MTSRVLSLLPDRRQAGEAATHTPQAACSSSCSSPAAKQQHPNFHFLNSFIFFMLKKRCCLTAGRRAKQRPYHVKNTKTTLG